jgi:type IV pilus assembly protein PilY1
MLKRGFAFDYQGLYKNYIRDELNWAWTTLAWQMKEGKKYLDDHKAGDTAAECRKKFLVLITDGWDTLACGGIKDEDEYTTRSFGYKRRRATVAAVKEAVNAGYQVFVVGFGSDMPLTERNTLNWVAYLGGTDNLAVDNSGNTGAITFDSNPCQEYGSCSPNQADCTNAPNDPGYKNLSGYAFLANDAIALGRSLQTIMKWVKEKAFSFTAPTVPSVRLTDPEKVYISSFAPNTTPFWGGDLKSYELNPDGTLPVGGDGLPSESPLWEAQSKLTTTDPGSRNIYTAKSGSRVSFTSTNVNDADLGISGSGSCNPACQDLIKHVRGYDPYDIDGDTNTSESRSTKLADIFHSQAVIVGDPSTFFKDQGYSGTGGFYDTKKGRTKVLIAGANDGMLHAFDAATGAEKWAFVPPSLLTNLKTMKSRWDTYKATGSAGEHLYYVDASPRVSDVWIHSSDTDTSKSVDEWRTVLINGLRKGGKTYFALDITDTTNPVYLWEFPKSTDATTLALVGQSWSDPTIGRVKIEGGDGELYERWVAFIGGGWDESEGKKVTPEAAQARAFFVVDIKTGEILWQFKYGATGENQYMKYSMAASPTAVDTNSDGYIDRVYMGDLAGQVWVFDLFFNPLDKTSNSLWSGKRLFKTPASVSEKHNIYYPVAVAFDKNAIPWVFFGTGDRENPIESGLERFYAVKDDGLGTYPRLQGDMSNVTSTNTFIPPVDPLKGWTINLTNYKEQALARPVVFHNLVYFTTFSPKESDTDVCTTGGTARLYVLHYLSGGGALEVDALSDLDGSAGTRSKIIGSGLPSAPSISLNAQGQAIIIVGTTESQVFSQQAFSPTNPKRLLYWRDVLY